MTENHINVLKLAILTHGAEAQLLVAMEECAELIQAISHELRGRNPKNLIEEIADVKIMVAQLEIIFGKEAVDDMVDAKIERLRGRLVKKETSFSLVCPHCDWAGSNSDLRFEFEKKGHLDEGIKWTCPGCEMVVHPDDEK